MAAGNGGFMIQETSPHNNLGSKKKKKTSFTSTDIQKNFSVSKNYTEKI